jgi:hypothetical protein
MSCHVMLDLETLGVGARPAIVQIGLVVFDADQILEGHRWEVDYDEDIRSGGEVHGSTLRWWQGQPEAARWVLTAPVRTPPCIAVGAVLTELDRHLPDACWANGVDWIWLESMWNRNHPGKPYFVPYNAIRDMRTLRKTVGRSVTVERDPATMHDALQDALWGARWLQQAHRQLGGVL